MQTKENHKKRTTYASNSILSINKISFFSQLLWAPCGVDWRGHKTNIFCGMCADQLAVVTGGWSRTWTFRPVLSWLVYRSCTVLFLLIDDWYSATSTFIAGYQTWPQRYLSVLGPHLWTVRWRYVFLDSKHTSVLLSMQQWLAMGTKYLNLTLIISPTKKVSHLHMTSPRPCWCPETKEETGFRVPDIKRLGMQIVSFV